MQTSEFIELD